MSSNRIAFRYAKSVLQLAVERNELEDVFQDMKTLSESLKVRELFLLVKSPIINGGKKRSIFRKLFGDKLGKTATSFFDIVIRKGRERFLPEIVTSFIEQYNDYKRITKVILKTAVPLEDAAIELIRNKLGATDQTKKNIDLEVQVDPKLIGGFTLQFDGKQYDSSIANKLAQLRKQFS